MRKIMHNQQGMIMPAVLMFLVVVVMIVGAVLFVQRSNVSTSNAQREGSRAQFVAEYGAHAVIQKLAKNQSFRDNPNGTFEVFDASGSNPIGSYTVVGTAPDSTHRNIVVTGNSQSGGSIIASRAITLELSLTAPASSSGNLSSYSLFSVGAITVSGSSTVNGNVGTNGALKLTGATRINGLAAAKTISLEESCRIIGGQFTGYNAAGVTSMTPGSSSTVAAFNKKNYSALTAPTGAKKSKTGSNYTYSSAKTIAGGSYYCPGTLTFDGEGVLTATDPAIIYSVGNVTIGNSGGLRGNFIIISEGTITISGAAIVNEAVCVSAKKLTISNSGSLKGAALSFSTTATTISGAAFVYDKAAYDAFPTVAGDLLITDPASQGTGTGDYTVNVISYI